MLWKEITNVGVAQHFSGCDPTLLRVEFDIAVGGV